MKTIGVINSWCKMFLPKAKSNTACRASWRAANKKHKEHTGSKNIFNPDNECFLITSDNLDDVASRLYGFMVTDKGIVENKNINLAGDCLSGAGAYVYVNSDGKQIKIHRDVNGSYGLFLFRLGTYFALSNSFFYLLDFLKDNFDLEFNKDFANYMLAMDLVSEAIEDTWIKEIKLLDKDAVVNIDVATSTLTTDLVDWKINTVPLDSVQGMAILDGWFARWTRLFRNIQQKTNNISIDLSGGFDSRIAFCLACSSGMDLNAIRVNSLNNGKNACLVEDFEIASSIADYFKFGLNKNCSNPEGVNFTQEDLLNINLHSRLPFHRQIELAYGYVGKKNKYIKYTVSGDGGENLRSYWNTSIDEHNESYLRNLKNRYSNAVTENIKKSVYKLSDKTIEYLFRKYKFSDRKSVWLTKLVYMNTRSARHFGGMAVLAYFANSIRLQPLLDPEILKLKFDNDNCPDGGLLIATIFNRYCPKLLDFKFEGGRSIDAQTINCAKEINAKYPADLNVLLSKQCDDSYCIITEDVNVAKIDNKNEYVSEKKLEELIGAVFKSNSFDYFIEKYFGRSVWLFAKRFLDRGKGFPLLHAYPLIIAALILRMIEGKKTPYNWLQTFDGRPVSFPLEDFCLANINIQGVDFDIIEMSDRDANVEPDKWAAPNKAFLIESSAMALDLKLKINADGPMNVWLRSFDDWDRKTGARIPLWIDYTKFDFDGNSVFDDIKPVWFKRPLHHSFSVKKDSIISLHIEWLPHRETRTCLE